MAGSTLKSVNVPPPHDGIDLVSTPDGMSSTRAPWMENFLVGNYGRLPVRGPAQTQYIETSGHKLKDPMSFFKDPVSGTPYITRANALAINKIRPDEIPYKTAAANSDLDRGATQVAYGNTTLIAAVYGRGANVNRSTYLFEYHNAAFESTQDAPVLNGPRQWKRRLMALSNAVLTTYGITQAPSCGVDVETHLNRVFVLGGYPPAVTSEAWTSSCLFFMGKDLNADGGPLTGTDTDWRDTSGRINRIEIPGLDNGKAIVRINQNLVIFKEKSIWVLYGSGPDSFTLRNVTSDIGLWDRDSLVEADGGVYFRSTRGIEFFDGTTVTSVSETIGSVFDDLQVNPFYANRCTAGLVSQNYIEFRMENLSTYRPSISFLLHRPTRNWTVFTGAGYGYRALYLRDGLWFAERDVTYTCRLIEATANHLVTANVDIPRVDAVAYYKPIRPGQQTYIAQFHRAFLDTKAVAFNYGYDSAAAFDVWEWFAQSSSEPDFAAASSQMFNRKIKSQAATAPWSPGGYGVSSYWNGRRDVVDFYAEAEDIFFVVKYTGSPVGMATPPVRAEIRGGAVEYQITDQRWNAPLRLSNPR